ncbi:uncharacterized protein LOC110698385 [Chenopodium quinoa]|uniref:uncharacterized protein LOC110698385 n=1 Tax=Chenopodium quinoa TaxID=63459 RepID=UPI000B787F3D|nr:uncharacterized protein LOC110698385 [Chenopodium quinoa]
MADELAQRYSALRLEEDEGDLIDLCSIEGKGSKDNIDLLLIGRLCTNRPYNVEAFKRTMLKVWNLSNNLVIRVLNPNLFAFQFFHWRDKEKILRGRPWCWENHLLILAEIVGDEQPDRVKLNLSPFWVRVMNLPFNCRSNAVVKVIVSNLGSLLEIEVDAFGLERYRRVRVMIDVEKPLRRYQWMKDKTGKEVRVDFKYERLPYLCFSCGIIGHSEKDCVNVPDEEKLQKLGWGLFLRASPRKGISKKVEEETIILASKKQLFITKDNDPSLKGDIAGEEDLGRKVVKRPGEEGEDREKGKIDENVQGNQLCSITRMNTTTMKAPIKETGIEGQHNSLDDLPYKSFAMGLTSPKKKGRKVVKVGRSQGKGTADMETNE